MQSPAARYVMIVSTTGDLDVCKQVSSDVKNVPDFFGLHHFLLYLQAYF